MIIFVVSSLNRKAPFQTPIFIRGNIFKHRFTMANIQQPETLAKRTPVLNTVSVDSLKVRIPLKHVDILDAVITEKWFKVSESGEVDPDWFKQNALERYSDQHELVKVRFGIEKQRTEMQTVDEYLTILLPAKVLTYQYFEGLTVGNIDAVYDTLMAMGIVSFTKYVFLHESACTDVDFKIDFRSESIDRIISGMTAKVRASKHRGDGIRPFRTADNRGIEFNERKTSRYKTHPFLKVYHKGIEMTTLKRRAYKDTYLKGIDIDNLCRVEATVKNKKHFRHLGVNDTSLFAILSLSQDQMQGIISNAVQCNLEPRIAPFRTPNELTPNKQMIHNAIFLLLNQGLDYTTIKGQLLNGIVDKSARSKKGKELDQVYNDHIRGNQVDTEAEELSRVYNLIGWQ